MVYVFFDLYMFKKKIMLVFYIVWLDFLLVYKSFVFCVDNIFFEISFVFLLFVLKVVWYFLFINRIRNF